MRTRLSLLAVLVACAAPRPQPPRGDEVLRVEGRVENAPFVFGTDDLPALPRRAFESVGPSAEGARHRYEGVALDTLLGERMELTRAADTVVVHGDDGTAAPVPLPILRQLRPVLADRVDAHAASPGEHRRPALLLAWPTSDHPGAATDPRLRTWWVHGVHRIDVQAWEDTYGRALRVPSGASDEARHGAEVVAARCIGCHAVRGVGGTRGPALTVGSLADRLRAPTASVQRHVQEVTGSAESAAHPSSLIRQVAAFLSAVRLAGPEPLLAPSRSLPPDEEPMDPLPPIGVPPIGR